jgi:hypothetical protein
LLDLGNDAPGLREVRQHHAHDAGNRTDRGQDGDGSGPLPGPSFDREQDPEHQPAEEPAHVRGLVGGKYVVEDDALDDRAEQHLFPPAVPQHGHAAEHDPVDAEDGAAGARGHLLAIPPPAGDEPHDARHDVGQHHPSAADGGLAGSAELGEREHVHGDVQDAEVDEARRQQSPGLGALEAQAQPAEAQHDARRQAHQRNLPGAHAGHLEREHEDREPGEELRRGQLDVGERADQPRQARRAQRLAATEADLLVLRVVRPTPRAVEATDAHS